MINVLFLMEISPQHLESANPISNQTLTDERVATPISSGIKGSFKSTRSTAPTLMSDPAKFKPSPSDTIQTGMKVLHLKFGEGKVLSIDGSAGSRVATIFFQGIDDPQRKIMLKFAKLEILS